MDYEKTRQELFKAMEDLTEDDSEGDAIEPDAKAIVGIAGAGVEALVDIAESLHVIAARHG